MRKTVIFFLIFFTTGILFFNSCIKDVGKPITPPFTNKEVEGFENSAGLPGGWSLANPDGDAAWEVSTTIAHTGKNCIGFNNCSGNGNGDMTGRKDRLISPAYDFSNATSVSLSFDVAYALLNFKNQFYPDSLFVFVSTDGGATWSQRYMKGGAELSNIPPITTSPPCWTPSAANEWRTDYIPLNNLAGQSNVKFAFENRSSWGEWVCLDNITVTSGNGTSDCDKITYAKDIEPIMKNNCATKGCHVPNGSGPADYTTFDGVKTDVESGELKKRMIDGNPSFMPPAGKLPQSDLDKVVCWLNAGAPNN
jgi:hypothetical protein